MYYMHVHKICFSIISLKTNLTIFIKTQVFIIGLKITEIQGFGASWKRYTTLQMY